MKTTHLVTAAALATALAACTSSGTQQASAPAAPAAPATPVAAAKPAAPQAPVAKVVPKQLTMHGHTRTDNYFWLNERENPEVINYLNAENAYTEAVMAHTKPLQEQLYQEMKGRIKEKDETVPYPRAGYYYNVRYETGKEYPIFTRRKGSATGPEEVTLDANVLAEGKKYFNSTGGHNVSPNGKLLAYATDTVSRNIFTLYFKNLETGKLYPEAIPNMTGGVVWANDNKTVFYTRQDLKSLRAYQVYRHTLGTDPSKDVMVYEEKDETYRLGMYKTKSQQYILINCGSTLSNEIRYIDANKPAAGLQVLLPREKDLLYYPNHHNGKFYIRTNWQAKNFRLMEAEPAKAGNKANWKDVMPHRPQVLLQGMELFKDYLVLQEREKGLTQVRVIRWRDKQEHLLEFKDPAYVAYLGANYETDTPLLRYEYNSLTTPSSTYDYNMATRTSTLLKQQEVVGGKFNAANYRSERVMVKAADGTDIPMSIVYHKDTPRNGTSPCLIYGYGSYGASQDPSFSTSRLSLLDRGFVFALAHVRGGQEMGRQWYEDGMMFKKKNTFTDFIACSEYLIQNKYSAKDNLFAMGGSAGGLLMGAIINMRPDLYKGVVAAVPFVDVISTMLDSSIPLTTAEYDEWGNPNNKDSYEYMLSYSPYDQVKAQSYPNLLITTGLHDSQVQYWEPAKWTAKLRTLKTDQNRLLLKTDMEAGHGGASGRFKYLRDVALNYAFMLDLAGKGGI